MKHFNNSLDRNVNLSNIPEFKPDYSPRTESFFVILLIFIGMAGAIYTFNVGFKTSLSNANGITKNVSLQIGLPEAPTAIYNPVVTEKKPSVEQLKIDGEKEANQKLLFTIESFNANADYILDFGNGKKIHPKEKTFTYAYQASGNYKVLLDVKYQGKSKRIFSNSIEIFDPIEVAPGANSEK